MNLRTYRARTMGDCLAEVKKDLGKDAVILHTRAFKVGGWLGLGAKPMVEVTASDGAAEVRKARSGNIAALKAYGVPEPSRPAPSKSPVDLAAQFVAARNEDSVAISAPTTPPAAPAPERLSVVRTGPVTLAPATVPAEPAAQVEAKPSPQMTEDLAAIRRMVGQVLQCSRQTALRVGGESSGAATLAGSAMSDPVFQIYAGLLERELAAELVDEVILHIQRELTAPQLLDGAVVQVAVLRYLAAMIPADGDSQKLATHDGRPLTLALIGPTGVGKTTTVAKLAATYKLRHGKRVGLVTSDTYRIAAVDQLRTYAEIIGLPLKVAMSPGDMASCCASLSDCDIVLIDTAGRSPKDAGRLDELRQFIDAARPHQTHLVLSSVSSEAVLMEAAKRFLPVKPDRVIFTKLDEAVNLGVIMTVARRIALRLSYITTGQEVPDHIEPGKPDRIARLLLEGSAVR
jgi:flagellar biosynthesis protein FlhF